MGSTTDAVKFSIERNEYFYPIINRYFYPGPGVTGENTVFVADLIVNEYVKANGNGELKWVSTKFATRYDCKSIPTKPDLNGNWPIGNAYCKQDNICKPG